MEFEIKRNDNSKCCFEQYLYNTPLHLSFQPSSNLYNLSLINKHTGLCHARFHFFIEGSKAYSSYKAPFGSVEFASDLEVDEFNKFITEIEIVCREYGAKEIEITSYPFCYDPVKSQVLFNCLTRAGYRVNFIDLNYHIDITANSFEQCLHISAKRRLKKSVQKGYTFHKEDKRSLNEFYDLYVKSRNFTGIPINMPFDKLKKYFDTFGDQYHIFTVRNNAAIIAATICINPSRNILYNFLPCDDPAYRNDSPMVLLMKGMVDYCIDNHITLLDLGISSIRGVPQTSLINFKKNLGALLSAKPQFTKRLL